MDSSKSLVITKLEKFDEAMDYRLVKKGEKAFEAIKRTLTPFKGSFSGMNVLGNGDDLEIAVGKKEPDEFRFVICGGRNGDRPDWEKYFQEITETTARLKEIFGHVWTIDLENDCPDDVFYWFVGARKLK